MKKQRKRPLLKPLTDEEINIILPVLIKVLKSKTNDSMTLTGKFIIDKFNQNKESIGFKCSFSNARFMKIINHIRTNELCPIISCSTGYHITDDPEKLEACAESMEDRCESILAAATGCRRMAANMRLEQSLKETCPLGFSWD
jgi:hypothetical protein